MGGSPSPGKANASKDRRQDLGRFSECKTGNWVRAFHGHRDMGPPIDHTGAEIGVPKGGHFGCSK